MSIANTKDTADDTILLMFNISPNDAIYLFMSAFVVISIATDKQAYRRTPSSNPSAFAALFSFRNDVGRGAATALTTLVVRRVGSAATTDPRDTVCLGREDTPGRQGHFPRKSHQSQPVPPLPIPCHLSRLRPCPSSSGKSGRRRLRRS